jgi:collagenase-like PrtC family protease
VKPFIPELAAVAGSPEALDAAIAEGADAVYFDFNSFSSRSPCYARLEGTIRSLRRMGKKTYIMLNTVFEEREADRVYQLLKYLASLESDGVLIENFGTAAMSRENFPSLKLFASTQMNVASSRGTNLLSRYGFSRVALARELSLEEIQEIRGNTNMELEVLVHGSLCASISGLCLFSSFLGGKSASRGICTHACRRFYYPEGSAEGGYYFSPNDLELIEKVPLLAQTGVNALRIEGRTKSAEYTGTVVCAYRLVLDSLDSGGGELGRAIKNAGAILRNDFDRPKTVYLFNNRLNYDWLNPGREEETGIPFKMTRRYPQVLKGSLNGYKHRPGRDKAPKPRTQEPDSIQELAEGLYAQVSRVDDLYVLQSERPVKAILNYNHDQLSRLLIKDKQPLPFVFKDIIIQLDPFFPQSEEAQLTEDIVELINRGYRHFIVNNPGHFSLFRTSKNKMAQDAKLGNRKTKDGITLIAGPWLYVFNSWSLAFFNAAGAEYFISPWENNRQNLERTLIDEAAFRRRTFVTVYSHPSLFRIRSPLGELYDFKNFSSSQDENFRLVSSSNGAIVYPETPFYIADKIPFLHKAGFRRFILDFSSTPLKKAHYKDLMKAAKEAATPAGQSRFNWKNGFYRSKEE